ncbi:GDSL esterase/lipase [Platanthera guangdongensis]|uniref:GDSL esterase/lipase n=1 Tax=Platanthera guangdongensis TaxID=2320717 RepID=A0ABR2MKM7_9ASPA
MKRINMFHGDSQAALHLLAAMGSFCLICAQLARAFAAVNETMKTPLAPAVFLFGDSIVDAGNNNDLETIFKCDFPPYGKDFWNNIPTGRFSNGKVPGDFIASILGVKETVPAYLSEKLGDEDLLTGSVISMPDQLKLFSEYKERVKAVAGEERMNSIISKGVFVVCAGSNDIANTYFTTTFRQPHYDIPAYVNLLVNSASDFIQERNNKPKLDFSSTTDGGVVPHRKSADVAVVWKLHRLGARKIGFVGLPPIGCLPFQITMAGELERKCDEVRNQASVLYNSKISAEIRRLAANFRDTKLVYLDIYTNGTQSKLFPLGPLP